jgi:hypothetical protein
MLRPRRLAWSGGKSGAASVSNGGTSGAEANPRKIRPHRPNLHQLSLHNTKGLPAFSGLAKPVG